MNEQDREQFALLTAPEFDPLPLDDDLERAEDPRLDPASHRVQPTVADLQRICNRSGAPSPRSDRMRRSTRKGEAMTRLMHLLAVTASVVLAAGTATAAGGIRPDDRATHGPGSIGIPETTAPARPDDRASHGAGAVAAGTASEIVRPDDRAWRGVGPAPRVELVQSP